MASNDLVKRLCVSENILPCSTLPFVMLAKGIIIIIIIIIIIVISCHRFSFFPGTSALEPVVNPTTQASSLSL
jgi:uncharacterized integral membrane protein